MKLFKKILGWTLASFIVIGLELVICFITDEWWIVPFACAMAAFLYGLLYLVVWLIDD